RPAVPASGEFATAGSPPCRPPCGARRCPSGFRTRVRASRRGSERNQPRWWPPATAPARAAAVFANSCAWSATQQDLEVMHEIVDRVSIGHDRRQPAGAIDQVDRRGMTDAVAAVGVHGLGRGNAVVLLGGVDLWSSADATYLHDIETTE